MYMKKYLLMFSLLLIKSNYVNSVTYGETASTDAPIVTIHDQHSNILNTQQPQEQYSRVKRNRRYGRYEVFDVAENDIVPQGSIECPPYFTGQHPYLLDCRQFLNCWKGRGTVQSCAPGTLFNPISRECDYPSKVKCQTNEGTYDQMLLNQKYVSDINSRFSSNDNRDYNLNTNNNNNHNRIECPKYTSGLFAHPYECNKFLNCDQGTVHIQECGPGTVFNPSLKVCDWPANVKCNTQNSGTTNVDDYGEGKLDIRISNEETAGTTYTQNHRYDLDSSATQNVHHGGYPGYPGGNTQNNYGDYNKKQHVNKVFYTLNNQTSSLAPPLPTTLPNMHNIKTSFKSNNQPATQSTNIPLISNSYSSVKTNHPLYTSPINNNFNTSSSHPERIDDPTIPHYPRITPTNTTFESNKRNTSFDRLDEYIRLLNSYNEHGKFNLKNNQSQLSIAPKFPQNSINDTLTESLRLLNNYNNNNNITDNNNAFYNKQLQDNVYPIYFRQTTSSTTETPSLSSFSQIKPISENSNTAAADTIKSDYNQQYHNLNKHISNKEPNLQTDYLPINDALKMLLRPYIHSNINNSTEQISNTAAKAMENQILNIVNNNEKIITNYTEPYEQKSLAKADFEEKYNIKINTVQTTTTTIRPTVIIRQPHPPHFPLHPTYFPSSYPPTHWSINHFNFNRLFPNGYQQTIIDNKQLTSINYTKTNIEDHNDNISQNDTEIIFSDYNPLRPTSPKPAMLPPTSQFHHSYEWHRTHNIPYPSMTKPNTNIDGNYHRNTDTEFVRSSEQDSLNEIPSSSSNKQNHNHNHNYHHHHHHNRNHNHNFQHSSDWHKSHGIPMPSSNRDTNTETNHNFEHSSEWHKSHGIPMPSSNSNGDIETPIQKDLIFSGTQNNNNNHQHHHNWDYLNINNNQQHNHGNRYHHNYHHNNNHHPNHYPISTTTDPTPNITPYFDFPSTTPSSFYYNRDRTTAPRNVLPLKKDNIGVPCDVGFNCQNGFCIPYDKVCDGKNNCGNRLDEQNCDHIGYEIRLSSDDIHTHMGRIEVKVFDKWGYVCDDKFGLNDANVLCRELGFPLGASEVRANSYYAANENMITNENDPIFIMDDVDCLGNETSLRECNFNGWGIHDCNKEEIVGVVCRVPTMKCPDDYWLCEGSEECIPTSFMCDNIPDCKDGNDELAIYCNAPIEYRLSGNEIDTEGRVEIKYHGIWGTICDDDFGNVEATVLCRSLGFGGPASLVKYTYGAGSGPIWLDQVSCIGNETSVDKCMHFEWGSHNCNHTEDVSVRCTRGSIEPITIQSESSDEINANQYIMQMQRHSKVLDDNSNTCGQIKVSDVNDNYAENQYRVVSGKTAKQGHHPWQATIRAKDRNGKSAHWCGAVLISNIHLLTAAHCLNGFSKGAYLIRVGDHNSDILEDTEIEVFIENIYVHEDFRRGQHMNNDLALVLFKSRITFTNYIQPICLPTTDLVYTPGMNCTISGWGSIQYGKSTPSLELRAASVPIIADEVCRQSEVYGNAMMDGMFCAGFLNAESIDACEGDSGGPLVCENNGIHVLYGIISWGHRCGYANKPGVYVKISHYLDWIGDKIIQSIVNT